MSESPGSTGRAAFFDMDRTLVRVNTGRLFLRWRQQRGMTTLGDRIRVSRWLLLYGLGVVDASRVTARALSSLAGTDEAAFRAECETWFEAMVRREVTTRAEEEVARRRDAGDVCAILSASTPYATHPLARHLRIPHVICSELEVDAQGRFTGDYRRPLCYGPGKVTRAERWAAKAGVDLGRSAFYSDSVSDLPMLERVGEPRVINPDPRLRVIARRRGWPVEWWT